MTDAWATIIASIITSVTSALVTLIVAKIGQSRGTPVRRKVRVIIYVGSGLIAGAAIGVIIGLILLTKPHPYARISEPTDGQLVSIDTMVTIDYNNIPHDRHLWLAVRIPGIGKAPWLIYPRLEEMEIIGTRKGVLRVTTAIGGDKDSGRSYNIVVLLADENANSRFAGYADDCKLDDNLCNGMILPNKGVEILDFDTVIRE